MVKIAEELGASHETSLQEMTATLEFEEQFYQVYYFY